MIPTKLFGDQDKQHTWCEEISKDETRLPRSFLFVKCLVGKSGAKTWNKKKCRTRFSVGGLGVGGNGLNLTLPNRTSCLKYENGYEQYNVVDKEGGREAVFLKEIINWIFARTVFFINQQLKMCATEKKVGWLLRVGGRRSWISRLNFHSEEGTRN